MGVKQNGATVMMILSDVTANKKHIYGKAKLDDYTRRGDEEEFNPAFKTGRGFYVAPKYKMARYNFIHSGSDTNEIAGFLNLGGMTDTHTPATYYLIVDDSKNLILKKK